MFLMLLQLLCLPSIVNNIASKWYGVTTQMSQLNYKKRNIGIFSILLAIIIIGAVSLGLRENDSIYLIITVITSYSYLLGSIPWGYILVKKFINKDIRTVSSGNTGATNVSRTGNWKLALITLALDIGKAALAVYLTRFYFSLNSELAYLSGLCVTLGHIYPFWLNFKGGKGVACAIGVISILSPWVGLIHILTNLFILFEVRIMSIASMASTLIAAISAYFLVDLSFTIMVSFMFIIIVITHRDNIKRIYKGNEPEIDLRSKIMGKK